MQRLSLALRLILALAIALVSVHTAIGRAEASGAWDVEFCVGAEVITVTLDAKGQPVKRNHTCPDCVLSGLAVLPDAAAPLPFLNRTRAANAPFASQSLTATALPRPTARGPPAILAA